MYPAIPTVVTQDLFKAMIEGLRIGLS